jgi:low temperature requirement protein LtrA
LNHTLWQKPRLHENSGEHRPVSWLELFFDLVFVAVISELVHLLSLNAASMGHYLFLFIPVWWIWIGATYYNDRFETKGLDNRIFTFLLMLPVAGLAIFVHHVPGNNSLGYGICYTLARSFIVLMWLRAWAHEKKFRPVGSILMMGYGVSITLFIISFWYDPSVRFKLWTVALICDLLTPIFTLKRQKALPHFNFSKLPERLGLFMLIVIGETLVSVIRGIARHHHLHFRIVSEGIMGTAISFAIWWIYFDYIAQKPPKQQHRTVFLWSYLHLILAMAIGAVGASLLGILTAKHHIPSDTTRYMLTGALAVALIFMGLIENVLQESKDLQIAARLKFITAAVVLLIGFLGHEYHALHLLILIFTALLIPIGYGVYLRILEPIADRAAEP